LATALLGGCLFKKVAQVVAGGEQHDLRKRAPGARPNAPETPPVLVLALDGVSRDLLYDMLHAGKLPKLAALLGGGRFDHAYFDDTLLSTMPSSTMAAWVTAFTGVAPAVHGVTGNEFFVRETRTFACPAPVSFADSVPTLEIYTDDAIDKLADAPTVYERLRTTAPDSLVWVAMSQVYRGADRLLMSRRATIASAMTGLFESFLEDHFSNKNSRRVYEDLDNAVMESVVGQLEKGPLPDVLTVYLSGTDLYAHTANEGPDAARRSYLTEVIEPEIGRLTDRLRARGALADRWVIVTADHGHTEVLRDHTLGTKEPPEVLRKAGFRVRPFKRAVDKSDPFSAVMAYGGAMAYVYLADRSRCAGDKDPCPWDEPPRYTEDVLVAAEAYAHANDGDDAVPHMKGTLDMILVRKPRPVKDIDLPFEVYVGGGKTMPIDDFLKEHPHPTYVALAARMHDLAVGVHGERAGDLLLIAHNGDRDKPEDRHYFSGPYRSWHGSPSRADSELPLIVANAKHSTAAIRSRVRPVLGDRPFQQKITDVILDLRK
jgi:predicted AlkP superfamily pyrophosphatase or phosphodiesterase